MTRMENAVPRKESNNYEVKKKRIPNLENLIEECNKVKAKWGLKENDIVFVLAFWSMIECGFQCISQKKDKKTFSKKNEKTLPKGWKHKTRHIYEAQFVLPPYFNCPVKLVALPAGDILCLNVFVTNISSKNICLKTLAVHSSKCVPRPGEDDIANKFSNLKDFEFLLRDHIIWPIRCSILSDQGIVNASLCGLPEEIKVRIFRELSLSDLLVLGQTCRDLNRICNDQNFWKILFHDHYKNHCKCSKNSGKCDEITDWKKNYKESHLKKMNSNNFDNSPSESYVTAVEVHYGSEIDFDID